MFKKQGKLKDFYGIIKDIISTNSLIIISVKCNRVGLSIFKYTGSTSNYVIKLIHAASCIKQHDIVVTVRFIEI